MLLSLFSSDDHFSKFYVDQSITEWNALNGVYHDPPILLHAAFWNAFHSASVLVSDGRQSVDQVDKFGTTALHWAAWAGLLDIGSSTLMQGANTLASDNLGRTPFHYACMRNQLSFLNMFKTHSESMPIKRLQKLLLKQDMFGYSPLHLFRMTPTIKNGESILEDIYATAGLSGELEDESQADVLAPRLRDGNSVSDDKGWSTTKGDAPHSQVNDIDVVDAGDVSKESVLRRYLYTQRPVLITANMTGRGKPWGIWQHMERSRFVERYGGLRVDTVSAAGNYILSTSLIPTPSPLHAAGNHTLRPVL